jgi:hypothetical protein
MVAPKTEIGKELLLAKERIIEHGWWQRGRRGCHIQSTMCPMIAMKPPYGSIGKCLGYYRRAIGTCDIGGWNDAPKRTLEEVLGAFDQAISYAEGDAA